jgi:hypothetical protein
MSGRQSDIVKHYSLLDSTSPLAVHLPLETHAVLLMASLTYTNLMQPYLMTTNDYTLT